MKNLDGSSFLFSIRKDQRIVKLENNKGHNEIYDDANTLTMFVAGFRINAKCDSHSSNNTNLEGGNYKRPESINTGSNESKYFLNHGSY